MHIDEHTRKAAIINAIKVRCEKYGCSGLQIAHGQMRGLEYYMNNPETSSHRAIEIGIGDALTLKQREEFKLDNLVHLAGLVH